MFDPHSPKTQRARRSLLHLAPAADAPRPAAPPPIPAETVATPMTPRASTVLQPPVAASRAAEAERPSDTARGAGRSTDQPLIDLATIADSVWRLRRVVIGTTVLGAVAGVALALATPNSYVAESKLYVDPREVRLTDSDLSKESLATEAILALIDSQLEVLRSRTVLEKVAVALDLEKDAEFGVTGSASPGSLLPGLGSGKSPDASGGAQAASQIDPRTLDKLSEAMTVSRDPKTFIVSVTVKSRDPAKAALIANSIVTTFFAEEQAAQSGFFQRTTAALDTRLSELRKELDAAESAVEAYKAKHDIVGAGGQLISDQTLLALNTQVGAARTRIAEARAKVDLANRTQLKDILTGAYPEEIASATLQELRAQYSQARAQLSALDASLGPRHPQRLAASQALESARSEIDNELKRIAASTRTELQRAIATEQDLLRQLSVGKAEQVDASSSFIELRELERKANATRTIYESFLKRASETGEEEKINSKNIRVISKAEPPLRPTGLSRKVIVLGGLVAGFAAGIGIGMMVGVIRSLRDSYGRSRVTGGPVPPTGPGGKAGKTARPAAPLPPLSPANDTPLMASRPQRPAHAGPRPSLTPADDGRAPPAPSRTPAAGTAPRPPAQDANAAAAAALAALSDRHRARQEASQPDRGSDMARLRSDLRDLRSRVERYQQHRQARRG